MAVEQSLLDILACPVDKKPLNLITFPEDQRQNVIERYREKMRDEEPVVEQGLQCTECARIYPVVSDIPVMLPEEAIESGAGVSA